MTDSEFMIGRYNIFHLSQEQRERLAQEFKKAIEKTLEIDQAIVAYLDILGFSNKTDYDEVEDCLVDFPGALVRAAHKYPNVRFNVFSDNAFIAADVKHVQEFLLSLNFIFQRLVLNGVFVRGGVALGTYVESISVGIRSAPSNFRGYLVSGSGVIKAVQNEDSKPGALLFTDNECAKFLESEKMRIVSIREHKVIPWTSDREDLADFVAISIFRLVPFFKYVDKSYGPIVEKLCVNILSTLDINRDMYVYAYILTLLSTNLVNENERRMICEFLKIRSSHFKSLRKITKKIFGRDKDRIGICYVLARADSSLPFFKKVPR